MRPTSFALLFIALAAACAPPTTHDEPQPRRVSSAVLNGRPSGDDENAAVYIETVGVNEQGAPSTLRCSGRIIAPALVVTARHCLLKRRSENVQCNPDGSPIDLTAASDVRVEPPESVTVFIGAQKSTARKVAVKQIFTELEISVCRSDVAYVVLTEAGLDTRTPIRREAPHLSDTVSITGWGYTSDDAVIQKTLPDTRSTIEKRVTEVGPGPIPADAFSIAGNSVCLGDSGASALAKGALLGVYSRIDNPSQCSLELNRNIFVWVGAHTALATSAFAAIGETPWYEGERPPWLAKSGAPCTTDDQCQSALCDATTSTCATACGDAGLACPTGKTCNAEGACVDPPAAPPPPPPSPSEDDSGCATSRAKTGSVSTLLVAAFVALALRRRGRGRY